MVAFMRALMLVATASFALAFTQSASATGFTYYKCTDEKGVVHFEMMPPKDKCAKIEKITGKAPPKMSGSSDDEAPAEQKKQDASKKASSAASSTAAAEKEGVKVPEICERAQKNLETLQTRKYVTTTDEYGNEKLLDEETVQAEIDRAQAAVDQHCD